MTRSSWAMHYPQSADSYTVDAEPVLYNTAKGFTRAKSKKKKAGKRYSPHRMLPTRLLAPRQIDGPQRIALTEDRGGLANARRHAHVGVPNGIDKSNYSQVAAISDTTQYRLCDIFVDDRASDSEPRALASGLTQSGTSLDFSRGPC